MCTGDTQNEIFSRLIQFPGRSIITTTSVAGSRTSQKASPWLICDNVLTLRVCDNEERSKAGW